MTSGDQRTAAGVTRRGRGTGTRQVQGDTTDSPDKIVPIDTVVPQRKGLRGTSAGLRNFSDRITKVGPSVHTSKVMAPKNQSTQQKTGQANNPKRTTPPITPKPKRTKVVNPREQDAGQTKIATPRLPVISPVRASSATVTEAGAPAHVMALGQSHEALLQMSRLSNVRSIFQAVLQEGLPK